jgi:hypothetical protein
VASRLAILIGMQVENVKSSLKQQIEKYKVGGG